MVERAARRTIPGSQRLLMGQLLGGTAVPAGKRASRDGECLAGVGRGGPRGTNMSAFLFKQTETADADCACGARTLGKGTGPTRRARALGRLRGAGPEPSPGEAGSGARPGPGAPAESAEGGEEPEARRAGSGESLGVPERSCRSGGGAVAAPGLCRGSCRGSPSSRLPRVQRTDEKGKVLLTPVL